MKFREIAQHNRASFFVVLLLLFIDVFVFIILYSAFSPFNLKYSAILSFVTFLFITYLAKGYNPSPLASRKREIKNLIKIYSCIVGSYVIYQFFINGIDIERSVEISTI